MKVAEIMTRGTDVVAAKAPLSEAAALMDECGVASLPVCDGQKLVGMVRRRALQAAMAAPGNGRTVADVMTGGVDYCFDDEPAGEIARRLEIRGLGCMVVLKRSTHRLVGTLSRQDAGVPEPRGQGGAAGSISLSRHS